MPHRTVGALPLLSWHPGPPASHPAPPLLALAPARVDFRFTRPLAYPTAFCGVLLYRHLSSMRRDMADAGSLESRNRPDAVESVTLSLPLAHQVERRRSDAFKLLALLLTTLFQSATLSLPLAQPGLSVGPAADDTLSSCTAEPAAAAALQQWLWSHQCNASQPRRCVSGPCDG